MAKAVWLTAREFMEFNQNYAEGMAIGYRYALAFFDEGQHLSFALGSMPEAYQLGYNQGWSLFVRTRLSPPTAVDSAVPSAGAGSGAGSGAVPASVSASAASGPSPAPAPASGPSPAPAPATANRRPSREDNRLAAVARSVAVSAS